MKCPEIAEGALIPVGLSICRPSPRTADVLTVYFRPCRLHRWVAVRWFIGAVWLEWA